PLSVRVRSPSCHLPRLRPRAVRPVGVEAGCQLLAVVAPLRLLVQHGVGDSAHAADQRAVRLAGDRGERCTGWLVHEGHELVGEAGHRAADADATDIGAAADAVHPTALWDVAVDDRSPAAEVYLAL